MLLGVVAVRAEGGVTGSRAAVSVATEGLGKGAAGRSRVRAGSVVDGSCEETQVSDNAELRGTRLEGRRAGSGG
jgi:hypothetical protein